MIAVELANLEFVLSDLLACLLRLDRKTTKTIYFTPKSTQARLETLMGVVDGVLSQEPDLKRRCGALVKRAMGIVTKRNGWLHDIWGVSKDDPKEIMLMAFPGGTKRPIQLQTLTDMIRDLRVLADEVWALYSHLALRPHYKVNVTYQISPERAE
jgi:hypothetical protein